MASPRRRRLEEDGWKVTTVEEFLGLTPEESALVNLRIRMSRMLRERRDAAQLSQAALAERIHSSQSRIAKAEAADATISVDLMLRALLGTGAKMEEIGRVFTEEPSTR